MRNVVQYHSLRVTRAKTLLANSQKRHWPVLGLESDFASIGPFGRAFSVIAGCTPGEFQQRSLQLPGTERSVEQFLDL